MTRHMARTLPLTLGLAAAAAETHLATWGAVPTTGDLLAAITVVGVAVGALVAAGVFYRRSGT